MADFTLRLPEELDELATLEGRERGRSKHRQILCIIEEHYGLSEKLGLPESVSRVVKERRASQSKPQPVAL